MLVLFVDALAGGVIFRRAEPLVYKLSVLTQQVLDAQLQFGTAEDLLRGQEVKLVLR